MVTIERSAASPYHATFGLIPIIKVAGCERLFPIEWIPVDAAESSPQFLEWLRPLVGPVPRLGKLKQIGITR
jgi:hypothetical protein